MSRPAPIGGLREVAITMNPRGSALRVVEQEPPPQDPVERPAAILPVSDSLVVADTPLPEPAAESVVTPPAVDIQADPTSPLPTISFTAPEEKTPTIIPPARPKIAIVIDDLGLSWSAFRAVNRLPGPVTLSFLPYGTEAQAMLDATDPGHDVMLHLPMEPLYKIADAGPNMLRAHEGPVGIAARLADNLGRLEGYRGVNNHTGSRFTANGPAMELVLQELSDRGLFFLDSVTTSKPVAKGLARSKGWSVVERDIFLDSDYPNVSAQSIKAQLAAVERIARRDGEAIAIGHPYDITLETLGPWLLTAPARGFDLVPVSALAPLPHRPAPLVLASLR